MNARAVLTGLAMLAAMNVAPAAAQSLSGTWQVTTEGRRGPQTMTLTLTQDGSELAGTVALTMGGRRGGGGGGAAMSVEVEEGSVDGNEFTFRFTMTMRNNSITQTYSGTFEGDTMQGTIEGGRGGGRPFTGERAG